MLHSKLKNVHCVDTLVNNEKNAVCSYIISSEKVCIVDCGPTAAVDELIRSMEDLGIEKREVEFVAITHVHLDHGGGVGSLLKHLKNARVLVHPAGFKHLIDPSKLWIAAKKVLGDLAEIYQAPEPCEKVRVMAIEDGQKIDLGDCTIRAIHTPGHAQHHATFYLEDEKVMFTGDSAGMYYDGIVIPTTPPPFDFEKSLDSINKMMQLKPEILAFTHFGFGSGNLLQLVYKKTIEWVRIAEEVVAENGDSNELYQKVRERDSEFRKILDIFKDSYIARKSYMLGFEGLINYVKGG